MGFRAALCETPKNWRSNADHGRGLFEAFRRRTVENVRVLGEARVMAMRKLPVSVVMMKEDDTGQGARSVRLVEARNDKNPRTPVSRVRAEGAGRVGLEGPKLGPNLPIGPVNTRVLIKATDAREYEPAQGLRGVTWAV